MVAKLASPMVPGKQWIHLCLPGSQPRAGYRRQPVSPELGTGGSQSAQSWVQEAARASVTHRGIASTVEMPDIPSHSGF